MTSDISRPIRIALLLGSVFVLYTWTSVAVAQIAPWQQPPGKACDDTSVPAGSPNPWTDEADERMDTIWGIHPSHMACEFCECIHDRIWFRSEFLGWWTKGFAVPALVTTSPAGTDVAEAGVLGAPGTSVLLGNEDLRGGFQPGERFVFGTWFGCSQTWGLEASYLQLNPQSDTRQFNDTTASILARPFFNSQSNAEDSQLVNYPGRQSGTLTATASSQLQAAEFLVRKNVTRRCNWTVDFTAGYRYQQLNDHLSINDALSFSSSQTAFPSGSVVTQSDVFDTRNVFQGGQVGLTTFVQLERFTIDATLKAAVGQTDSQVTILGASTTNIPGQGISNQVGGLLALPSNMGVFESQRLSIVPELALTLGWDFTPQLRGTVGYDLVYWTGVARPGDQIDLNLDPRQFPPTTSPSATRPQFVLHTSDYWAQGFNLGLDWRF
jgi:hypothetical protein